MSDRDPIGTSIGVLIVFAVVACVVIVAVLR